MNSFCTPNCTQTILDNPDLVDTCRPIQQLRLSTITAGVNNLTLMITDSIEQAAFAP